MKQLSQTKFYLSLIGLNTILFLLFSLTWNIGFPNDYYYQWSSWLELKFGAFHTIFNFISILFIVIFYIFIIVDWGDRTYLNMYKKYCNYFKEKEETKKEKEETKMETKTNKFKFTWKKGIVLFALFYLFTILFNFGVDNFKKGAKMYNTSKIYHNNYTQKVQEKKGFYDKLWKTYLQKEKITNINKETFLQVTKMIMENRADGKNLSWKWLQENQQISYEQFTIFYADLSDFITSQREGYFGIEKECQLIASQNNTLLDTFPNNMYNKILKLKRIDFEYGFTSDSTEVVFTNKKENLK